MSAEPNDHDPDWYQDSQDWQDDYYEQRDEPESET